MKWLRKCPVFALLVVSGLILTGAGFFGKHTIYEGYPYTLTKVPYLALVMNGAKDGIFPWDAAVFDELHQNAGSLWKEMAGEDVETILMGENSNGAAEDRDLKEQELYEKLGISPKENASENQRADAITSPPLATLQEQVPPALPSFDEVAAAPDDGAAKPSETEGQEIPADVVYSFQTVQEEYFQDALFIGDSRTVGMSEYGAMPEGTEFFCQTSLTIYAALTKPVVTDETGKKITVEEALSKKQYGKIYLMLGINELGTGDVERFMVQYKSVVDRIKELQPDAVIFVQAIMNVTDEKSAGDPIFNNSNIGQRNTEIAKLADNRQIFYLDVNTVVGDESGALSADYTGDGIHLKAAYYKVWKQYLLDHGILR